MSHNGTQRSSTQIFSSQYLNNLLAYASGPIA